MLSATSASRGTRLLQACAAGDRAAALEQLERGPPAAACVDAAGWSPALYAARHGWDDVLQALGPTDARLSSSGNTALHIGALHGHLQVVRLLLQQLEQQQQQPAGGSSALPQRGCVDAPNRNADTPLMFAASAGHLGVAAALLKAGASPGAANADGISPLLAAAGRGHAAVLELLRRHAGPAWPGLLAARDTHGRSALHFAAASGHADVVAALLAPPGADVWAVSGPGHTALQEATRAGHRDCARLIQAAMEGARRQADEAAAALMQQEGRGRRKQAAAHKGGGRAAGTDGCGAAAGKPRPLAAQALNEGDSPGSAPDAGDTAAAAANAVAAPAAADGPSSDSGTADSGMPLPAAGDDSGNGWTAVAARKAKPKAPPAQAPNVQAATSAVSTAGVRAAGAAAATAGRSSASAIADYTSAAARAASYSAILQQQQQQQQQSRSEPLAPLQQQQSRPEPPAPLQQQLQQSRSPAPAQLQQLQAEPPAPLQQPAPAQADAGAAPAWWEEAVQRLADAVPAAAELDLQPQHVLGVGLEELSPSQVDALELAHRASLVRLSELRIQLAVQQHEQQLAEQAALKREIARLAAARKAAG